MSGCPVLFLGLGPDYLRKYVPGMRSLPRVGEYVDLGDNLRRYVVEVTHDIDPDNVPVRIYLKDGNSPSPSEAS